METTRTQNGAGTAARKYAKTAGDIPEGTVVELFFRAADEHDKDDAYLQQTPDGWRPLSHRDVLQNVHAIFKALSVMDVARGDRIAILSENRLEWAITDFAVMCVGAVSVPVYPTLPADQVAAVMAHSGARFVFVSTAAQYAKLKEVRSSLPDVERIFTFDEVQGAGDDGESFRSLLEQGRALPGTETEFRLAAQAAKPEDVLTLIYTSGTTGTPKGVMLTHNNLHSNVVATLPSFPIAAADVALSFLTLSHVFQRMVDYAVYSCGVTIAHLPDIDQVARAFADVRPTLAVAVPRVYEKLYTRIMSEKGLRRRIVLWARAVALDWAERRLHGRSVPSWLGMKHSIADRLVYRKVRERLGGRLRFFISGGAPLNPQLAYFFYGVGIKILEGYGLTETSPVTNANPPDQVRVGTVGPPVLGTEIRIAEDGEILVRGPQVMKGYYRNPEATREAIDDEGWFHTGDIGDVDADGYLRITDRKKDLLVTAGGKNIAPQPIENAVKGSRYISEAVMLGDRRPYAILLAVPNFGQLEDWAGRQGIRAADRTALVADPRVRAFLEDEAARRTERFARFERPKKVLALERELSLERQEITPSLKVKRRVVEEHFRDRIEALYAEPLPAEAAEAK